MTQTNRPKPPSIGEVGWVVVRNTAALSDARGLSLRKLSERLAELGRPILPSALHALSQGQRRVDADDLVALAIALGVNPNALLFPRRVTPGHAVALTPQVQYPAGAVWRWASGDAPLPDPAGGTGGQAAWMAETDFALHAGLGTTAAGTHRVLWELRNLTSRVQDLLADPGNPATYEPRERVLMLALERVSLEVRELANQARVVAAERSQPGAEVQVPLSTVRLPGTLADPFGQRGAR